MSTYHSAALCLKLDVTLSLDKGSVPWHLSLSARKLGIEISMCFAINLHALDAAISLALIGVEETV